MRFPRPLIWLTQPRKHTLHCQGSVLDTACPHGQAVPVPPGTELQSGITSQPGNTTSMLGGEANLSWEYFWILFLPLLWESLGDVQSHGNVDSVISPRLVAMTRLCVSPAWGSCWNLVVPAINSYINPDNF